MKQFKHFLYMAVMLLVGVTMGACSDDDTTTPDEPVVKDPSILVTAGSVTETTISFTVTPTDAEEVRYACVEKTEDFVAPEYVDVHATGTQIDNKAASNQKVENLKPGTTYVVLAVASGNKKIVGQTIEMTTSEEPVTVAVAIEAGEVKPLSLEFTVTPTDATKLHWAAYEKGMNAPVVDEVLENGNALEADKANTVLIREVKPATTYVIMAVAADDKHTVYEEIEISTPEANIAFDAAYKLADKSSADRNPYLQFTCEDYVFEFDFYHVDTPCAYLPAGTYTYSAEGDSGVFSAYSQIKYKENGSTLDTPKLKFAAGTVTVEIVEKSYKFTFDLTLAGEGDENGGVIKGSYEGLVDGMEVVDNVEPGQGDGGDDNTKPEVPADAIELPTLETAAWVTYYGKEYVSLSFADNVPSIGLEVNLVIPADKAIEPGLYSFENGKFVSAWMQTLDYGDICDPSDSDEPGMMFDGSWVFVAKDESGVYTIDIVMITAEGKTYHAQYVGSSITEMPEAGAGEGVEADLYPEYATAKIFNGNEVYLQFYESSRMNDYVLTLDLYTDAGITTLPVGEYFFGSEAMPGELNSYSYYAGYNSNAPYYTKGESYSFTDGMVFVEYVDDAWFIMFDITLKDGTYLYGGFNGQIAGLTAPTEGGGNEGGPVEFTSATYGGTTDLGSHLINFANADATTTFALAFIPFTDTYEGTYKPGIMGKAGEFDYFSSLYVLNGAEGIMPTNAAENSIVIAKAGDNWKVDIHIEKFSGSDETLIYTYEGAISGLPELGGGNEEGGSNFTVASFAQKDGDIYWIEMFDATYENYVTLGFKPVEGYVGTYSSADGSMDLSYTKNMGFSASSFYGDNATAGTMTVATDDAGWKITFDLTFDGYTLKDSYTGPVSGMGGGGAGVTVTELTYDECVLYSRDNGDGDQYTTNLVTASLNGKNELNISFYQSDLSALAGTYSTEDGSILIKCPWGTYTRFDSTAPSVATLTLTATGEANVYELDASFTVGEKQYHVTCPVAKYVIPEAPGIGGMSR